MLFLSEALTVAQASLTGELMPVDKTPCIVLAPPEFDFDLIDNQSICLAGTSVATGSGRAMVVSTRDDTYMASIAKDLDKKRPLNAMQSGVRKVSYILLAFMLVSDFILFCSRPEGRAKKCDATNIRSCPPSCLSFKAALARTGQVPSCSPFRSRLVLRLRCFL